MVIAGTPKVIFLLDSIYFMTENSPRCLAEVRQRVKSGDTDGLVEGISPSVRASQKYLPSGSFLRPFCTGGPHFFVGVFSDKVLPVRFCSASGGVNSGSLMV